MSISAIVSFFEKKSVRSDVSVFLMLLCIGIVFKTVFLFFGDVWCGDFEYYMQGGICIAKGGVLYRDFGDLKPPVIFFLFAFLFRIAGYAGIFSAWKIFVIIHQTVTAMLFFKTGERFGGRRSGFAVSLLFLGAILGSAEMWEYNVMIVSVLPIILSFYLLIAREKYSIVLLVLSGFSLSIGFLLSTNIIFLTLLYPVYFYIHSRNIKQAIVRSIPAAFGFAIPLAATFLYFYRADALYDLYWWTVLWANVYNATALNPVFSFFAHI